MAPRPNVAFGTGGLKPVLRDMSFIHISTHLSPVLHICLCADTGNRSSARSSPSLLPPPDHARPSPSTYGAPALTFDSPHPATCSLSELHVRVPGIEPGSFDWQPNVLPLNHTRFPKDYTGAYELGNYCARRDSNPQPLRPKRNALSLELRAQTLRLLFKSNMVEQQILQKLHFS